LAAFSRYPSLPGGHGHSVKTDRYRYTRWKDGQGQQIGRMLFDHQTDPDENVNIVEAPARSCTSAPSCRELLSGNDVETVRVPPCYGAMVVLDHKRPVIGGGGPPLLQGDETETGARLVATVDLGVPPVTDRLPDVLVGP